MMILSLLVLILIGFLIKFYVHSKRRKVIAFFHPYCNDGGGGERVLWMIIEAIKKNDRSVRVVVYTGDRVSPDEILDNAFRQFGIRLDDVEFVYLRSRSMVEASRYPAFTMFGQSLGSVVVGVEALFKCVPTVCIDSMGYSFTYPVFRYLGGCNVIAYVHYPTISTDMLQRVTSNSSIKSTVKYQYYRLFSVFYYLCGKIPSVVMCNSTWTANHIRYMWKRQDVEIVYPPVNVSLMQSFPIERDERLIISLGMFRPEKNHDLQIEIFNSFFHIDQKFQDVQFVMIGGLRSDNLSDVQRVETLRMKIDQYGLQNNVQLLVNAERNVVHEYLSRALVGIHTMKDEHFGISVVELMASGVIPIAHDSAGPKEIIEKGGGFLANTQEEYVSYLESVFSKDKTTTTQYQHDARDNSHLYTDETFKQISWDLLQPSLRF